MPLPNGEKAQLLTLPAEIKNKIWDHCLDNHVKFYHNQWGACCAAQLSGTDVWSPNDNVPIPNPHLGLLLTCKSIYYEVQDLKSSTSLIFCSSHCASDLAWNLHSRKKLVYHDKRWSGYEFVIKVESIRSPHGESESAFRQMEFRLDLLKDQVKTLASSMGASHII